MDDLLHERMDALLHGRMNALMIACFFAWKSCVDSWLQVRFLAWLRGRMDERYIIFHSSTIR